MCVTKQIRTGRFYRQQAEHKKLWIFFLDLCTCSLLSKISLNSLMSLLWDCRFETAHSPHFRKQKAADIPAWNTWLCTWLWIRVLSGGIWRGCASASRAHLLSWAKSLSMLQPLLLLDTERPVLNTIGPAHRILDAVHSPGKINRMAGKEQM